MSKLSLVQKVVEFLKANPHNKFTARQIAEKITSQYPEDYHEKRQNSRFPDDKSFISQVAAEIGAKKDHIVKNNNHIFWLDKPSPSSPRVFWYDLEKNVDIGRNKLELIDEEDNVMSILSNNNLSEYDLYPILISYLKSEFKLYCQRIDEKCSINTRGNGGNHWLHPDIVAMQAVDREWHDLVRNCLKQGAGKMGACQLC